MRRPIIVSLLLVFATFAAYWPIHNAGFLNFDDNQYITNNPKVFQGLTVDHVKWAFTTFHACNWHPLTWLSHMLDCQVFGDHPAAHHWVNVALHAANSVILFLLVWRITGFLGRSAFVAGLFALHPLHVESVAWIAERKDVLSTFFALLAIWAYANSRKSGASGLKSQLSSPDHASRIAHHASFFHILSLLLFACSLMSKPMLVTLPFLLLLLDYWPLRRIQPGEDFKLKTLLPLITEKLPFFALSLASCIVTFYAQKSGGAVVKVTDVPLEARFENAATSCFFYLAKVFWPARLGVFYPYPDHFRPVAGAAAALGLLVLTVLAFTSARRARYVFTGWFWYLGSLVPVIGLVQVGSQVAADRYTYIPLIGIFFVLAWGIPDLLARFPNGSKALAPAAAAVLVACAAVTWNQVHYWRDSVTLFTRALAVGRSDNNPIVHHNLGHALSLAGNQEGAVAHFKEALRYRPDFPAAHFNWGNSVGEQGKVEEAIEHYHDAIRYDPKYEQAHFQLGNAYALQDKLDLSEASFREAIRLKPDYSEAFVKLANLLDIQGRRAEARSNWLAALKFRPDYDEAHYYLAGSFAREKNFGEAIPHFRAALKANPQYRQALNDLAWILATQTNTTQAQILESIRFAEQACRYTSRSNASYLDTLAVALSEAGRFGEAATTASNACAIAERSGSPTIASQLRTHLELFTTGKPYHEIQK